MKNKKTSIPGFLLLAAAALQVVAAFLSGGDIVGAITSSLLPALSGAGLLVASDGAI